MFYKKKEQEEIKKQEDIKNSFSSAEKIRKDIEEKINYGVEMDAVSANMYDEAIITSVGHDLTKEVDEIAVKVSDTRLEAVKLKGVLVYIKKT